MPDPRAVPEAEVRERLAATYSEDSVRRVLHDPQFFVWSLSLVGLRWDGTTYLDTEGSQE